MQTWIQWPLTRDIVVKKAEARERISMDLFHVPSRLEIRASLQLEGNLPEFTLTLSANGGLGVPLSFPHPFLTGPDTYLVIPMNEGISYPVGDVSISAMRLPAYEGERMSMSFWGVTDGERGHMVIIETPDDAAIRIDRAEGRLCVCPEWDSVKSQFGSVRRLRYVFFDRGGYVAMCKRYRTYAQENGLFRKLEQKRQANPNVDLLVGAVNVWCWEEDALSMIRQMKSVGIERILWSYGQPPETIKIMNNMGILTSDYDNFQDLANPEDLKYFQKTYPRIVSLRSAWPKDLILDSNGDWVRGWEAEGNDGRQHTCGVLCDSQALKYVQKLIPEELENFPYRCRFIDTATGSPWRECYNPDHPMTRKESREWRMKLLQFVSEQMGLVTGSETGHEAAVPYVHYFEGMLSLVPYRVPDAGRNLPQILETVPDLVAKFQVGYRYRLPLWELVYHDCVVAQWYWGDYSNRYPALWDKRDLFNILYGTPPMFVLHRETWQKNRDRFIQSYRNVCPIAREVGYSEMVDHRFLTENKDVQQTIFANGVTVIVNFGNTSFFLPDGTQILPAGFHLRSPSLSLPERLPYEQAIWLSAGVIALVAFGVKIIRRRKRV